MFQESSISDGKVPILGVPAVGRKVGVGGTAVGEGTLALLLQFTSREKCKGQEVI